MRKYTISSTKIEPGNILHLALKPTRQKDRLEFEPGQYASISYKVRGRTSPMRSFSIVGKTDDDVLHFAVRIGGNFTQSLASLPVGSVIKLRGPFGSFIIDQHYDRNIVMIAGGIGITPFISMVRESTEQNLPNKLILLYSNSDQSSIPFVDEINHHEQINQQFKYALFISKGDIDSLTGKRAVKGRIKESHLANITKGNFNRCTYFICGPKNFITNYKKILIRNGVSTSRIVTEEFALANTASSLIAPKDRASRFTYAMTMSSLILGTAFIGTLDLARYLPRYASAQALQTKQYTQAVTPTNLTQAAQASTTTPSSATTNTSQNVTNIPPSTSNTSLPASTSTVTSPPVTQPVTTPAPTVTPTTTPTVTPVVATPVTPTYQAPVTKVS